MVDVAVDDWNCIEEEVYYTLSNDEVLAAVLVKVVDDVLDHLLLGQVLILHNIFNDLTKLVLVELVVFLVVIIGLDLVAYHHVTEVNVRVEHVILLNLSASLCLSPCLAFRLIHLSCNLTKEAWVSVSDVLYGDTLLLLRDIRCFRFFDLHL
jgi:hypothetical protein